MVNYRGPFEKKVKFKLKGGTAVSNSIKHEWIKPNPNEEGYLLNTQGVLLMAFNLMATDPNDKTRVFVNKVICFATQRGYKGAKLLKRSLNSPNIRVDNLVNHVVEIYPFLGTRTVQQLLNG